MSRWRRHGSWMAWGLAVLTMGLGAGPAAAQETPDTSPIPSPIPSMAALERDRVTGTVGAYDVLDDPIEPGVRCSYLEDASERLARLVVDGPVVGFSPDIGEVGWVDWATLVQKPTRSGAWKTIARGERRRETVDVYGDQAFADVEIPVGRRAGRDGVRLVSRLTWIDQGNQRQGRAQHVMQHYGQVPEGPDGSADVVGIASGTCPGRWTPSSLPPEPTLLSVVLANATDNLVSIDISDASGRLVGASSGAPGGGASVAAGEISVTNETPTTLSLAWSGGPCDAVDQLLIDPTGRQLALVQPACPGDAVVFDRILLLEFAEPVAADEVQATIQERLEVPD